jgi:hypothetical protein
MIQVDAVHGCSFSIALSRKRLNVAGSERPKQQGIKDKHPSPVLRVGPSRLSAGRRRVARDARRRRADLPPGLAKVGIKSFVLILI